MSKKFKSIKEVRQKIDDIDSKILNLIAERKNLVVEAVKHKKREQITDWERINYIISCLNDKAKVKELPEGLVQEMWMVMIKKFIKYEEEIFDQIHK